MKNLYMFLMALFISGFGFGQDSRIVTGTQPTGGTISSLLDAPADYFEVLEFTIQDVIGDGLPTIVTNMNFQASVTNTADWTNTIQAVRITSGGSPLTSLVPQINAASIDIGFLSGNITIVEGASQTFSLEIYLKSDGNIVDNSVLSFFIEAADSGFSAAGSGSSTFETPLSTGDINGNDFTIEVVATTLTFLQQPTDVTPGVQMTPAVRVGYTDVNGNVDVNRGGQIFVENSNFYVSTNDFDFPSNGVALYDNLRFVDESAGEVLIANSPSLFIPSPLPGVIPDIPIFVNSNTFDVLALPAQVTYTYDGSWDINPNGVSAPSDIIVIESGDAIINTNTFIYTVVVQPGASLKVNSGRTFSVIKNMTLKSVSNSYSSFIFNGLRPSQGEGTVVGGTLEYERFVNSNANGNDLISAPFKGLGSLVGQRFGSFLNLDTNATDLLSNATINAPAITYAFGPFIKNQGDYVNYTSDDNLPLTSGTGFRAATNSGTTLTFSGDVPNTPSVGVSIFFEPSQAFADWNLIGNPYPSYISAATFLSSTQTSATPNVDKITPMSGIYGYDGDASDGWDIITVANAGSRLLAPGQGFLIPCDPQGGGSQVTNQIFFDKSMRSVGSSDDLIPGRNADNDLVFFKLKANTTSKSYKTEFYFNNNATLGADHGYDGRILGGAPSAFALYSHLVEENTGIEIGLQALNPIDLEGTTVPLGVNANQGEQLTFSILESSLPDSVEVYLEDTVTNTFTLLNTGDYVLTPSEPLSGVGRFFLNFSEGALSTDDPTLNALNIFTNQADKTIVIKGQLLEATTARLYDVQGRLVSTTALQSATGAQSISVGHLSAGIYVIQLENTVQNKTQKVILR